jgi:fermentation-respiration switch protein FrsA (DUF1100 family)
LGLPARAEQLFYRAMEMRNGVPNELLDIERLAGSLRQPVLVVHDREDRAVPFADGQRIAYATGGLMLATTGLGHGGILRDPMVAQRIRRYLGD